MINNKIEKLRFKDDNGNEYPVWEEKTLGEIGEIVTGKTPDTTNLALWNGDIQFITPTDIKENNKYQIEVERFVAKTDKLKILPAKSIIFTCIASIGKMCISIKPCITNQQINSLIPFDNYNNEFIYYSILFITPKIKSTQANTTLPIINKTEFSKFKISVPCLEEQTKIADFLSSVDEKIEKLEQELKQLKEYKKGVMQQLFDPEGFNIDGGGVKHLIINQLSDFIRFKDDNGNEYPEWEVKTLGKITEINPSNNKVPDFFIYIDLESVVDGKLIKENLINKKDAPSRAQRVLLKKDILFQMVRPYQKNNFYFNRNGDYVASTGYAQIRTNQNSLFVYQYLHYQKFVDKVIESCTGTSYPAINSSDLSKIEIRLPCLEEQTKIGSFLSDIDEKINLVAVQFDTTKEFKKGVMQQIFV